MMNRLKGLALLLGVFAISGGMAKDSVIRFGTNPEYPPFEYKTEHNEITGFDIDVANALCEVLQKKCEFVEQQFDALIPNLKLKRFDAIISSMDVTEERAKQISFSDAYYLNPSVFVAKKGKFTSAEELKGKKIGVLNGSTHQLYIRNKAKDSSMSSYPQYPAAMNDLLIDRVDAVFGDQVVVAEFLKRNDNIEIFGELVTDPEFFGNGLAIGVLPKNKALLEELNRGLKMIKDNGRYQEVFDKWFK